MLLVSTTRIIPGRAVPSFLSGRYPAVKVRKKLYVTIDDCLSSLNDVIIKAKNELAKWQELKKGLLQQMFV